MVTLLPSYDNTTPEILRTLVRDCLAIIRIHDTPMGYHRQMMRQEPTRISKRENLCCREGNTVPKA